MLKKCMPLWREEHFQVKMFKQPHVRTTFKIQLWFCVAGARDSAPCQKWAKRGCFVAFPETMAGVGHLKRICKDAFSVAGAVQKTCSWEMLGGQGADFLRGVAFWSIRSVGLLRWLHLHYTTLYSTLLHSLHYNYTTLHYTNCITLHYATTNATATTRH